MKSIEEILAEIEKQNTPADKLKYLENLLTDNFVPKEEHTNLLKKYEELESSKKLGSPRSRPEMVSGRTQKILTGHGSLYVTINEDDKGLFEIFVQTGRGGGYTASFTEAIARLVSLYLRSGGDVEHVVDQLEGIRSGRVSMDDREKIYSIPDAIAKSLKRHTGIQTSPDLESQVYKEIVARGLNPQCPQCGSTLTYEEGCVRCIKCGYTEC